MFEVYRTIFLIQKIMKPNPLNYQEEEAAKNKAKAESESLFSGKTDAPVQMFETEGHINEEEIKEAIDEIIPDKNSMDSRG
jgi:hypothetical protein